MQSFRTIEGVLLDLDAITEEQCQFLERCVSAYQAGMPWAAFMPMVRGVENPLVRETGGVITRAVYDHPLYRAVHDLENRLGIQQGHLRWEKPLAE